MNRKTPLRRKPWVKRSAKQRKYRKPSNERAPGDPIKGQPCAYCGAPAVNGDHVIPRALVKRYNRTAPDEAPSIPVELLAVVPSCFACNNRKSTRRLVPPSWAKHVDQLNEFFGGSRFMVWNGDPKSEAFRAVHR